MTFSSKYYCETKNDNILVSSKLGLIVYTLLLKDVHNNVYNHKWIALVKSVLDDDGSSYIWLSQYIEITSDSVSRTIINTRLIYNYGILILIARLKLQVINC